VLYERAAVQFTSGPAEIIDAEYLEPLKAIQ